MDWVMVLTGPSNVRYQPAVAGNTRGDTYTFADGPGINKTEGCQAGAHRYSSVVA